MDTTILRKKNRIRGGLGSRAFDIFNVILFLILALVMILPFWNVLVISLTTQGEFYRRPLVLLPYGLNLTQYKYILGAPTVPRAYGVSIAVTLAGTTLSTLFTSMLAYPLSKKRLFGRGVFTVYLLITMFFSGGLIPTYLLISNTLNLKNNLLALILPSGVSVWNFIIMRTFFRQLPDSMEESAKIDGANDLTILFRIIYPLSIPMLSTLALFVGVGFWNAWFAAQLYISDAHLYPLQLVLRRMLNNATKPAELAIAYGAIRDSAGNPIPLFEEGVKMTMVVVTVLPLLLVYPFMQKYFEKGIMLGSVKG